MAGATLNLAALQALIALGGYGGRGFYEPSSAVLGLSAALFLSDLTIWQGAGDTLTSGEIDDIQELIAQLECDMMMTGEMYAVDRVKIYHNINQSIAINVDQLVRWNSEYYDPEDMHSLVLNDARIYAVNDGMHLINVNILWATNSVGTRKLWLSHVPIATGIPTIISSNYLSIVSGLGVSTQVVSTQAYLLEGDYLQCAVKQTSPVPLLLLTSTYAPTFSVVRL